MNDDRPILIAGAGSIAKRHIRNLYTLGYRNLAVYNRSPEALVSLVDEYNVQAFVDYEQSLDTFRPSVVFICTPTAFHIAHASLALKSGAHLFIEKPLSHSLEGVDALAKDIQASAAVIQVAYPLRFHPALQQIKALLDDNAIGHLWWARAEFGQYLPDWRPQRDYRQSYTARKALGGGIILDMSHELDYVLWLLGNPVELVCMGGTVSDLDVDVEDCVTMLLRFENGAQADIHVDCIQRVYSRICKIVGARGTIEWQLRQPSVRLCTPEAEREIPCPLDDLNAIYQAQVAHFFRCIDEGVTPIATLDEAIRVLRISVAALTALERKESISL